MQPQAHTGIYILRGYYETNISKRNSYFIGLASANAFSNNPFKSEGAYIQLLLFYSVFDLSVVFRYSIVRVGLSFCVVVDFNFNFIFGTHFWINVNVNKIYLFN